MTEPATYVALLAIGESSDTQFRLAAESAAQASSVVRVIDAEAPTDFSITLARDGTRTVRLSGEAVRVGAFWYRRKFPSLSPFAADYAGVIRTEWMAFLSAIPHVLDCPHIHMPTAALGATKPSQLKVAAEAGFIIPASVFGLGKASALAFAADHPAMVLKALHAARVVEAVYDGTSDALITTPIDAAGLIGAGDDEFTACPFFLQERFDGLTELRVIAFGSRLYPYEVVDPDGVAPMVDRRMMRPGYRLVDPPAGLAKAVGEYFRRSGVRYGVFDVLVHAEGIVFLECNPEGQWHSANGINMEDVAADFAAWLVAGSPGV